MWPSFRKLRYSFSESVRVKYCVPLYCRADGLYCQAALWAAVSHRGSNRGRRGQHCPRVCNSCCAGLRSAGLSVKRNALNSSTPAGLLTSQAFLLLLQSGLPYIEVLCKNRYVGRTFIQPNTRLRQLGVAKKFGALTDNFAGKRVVLIDDSIVRGNTISPIIKLLKEAGATEVCYCAQCWIHGSKWGEQASHFVSFFHLRQCPLQD